MKEQMMSVQEREAVRDLMRDGRLGKDAIVLVVIATHASEMAAIGRAQDGDADGRGVTAADQSERHRMVERVLMAYGRAVGRTSKPTD